MAITSADRQSIVDNIRNRLRTDGLYVDSMQARIKYFRNTTSVPVSASPFQTSGTHSALDVIIDDVVHGITDFYSVSAIGVSAIGISVVDPISANGLLIGLKYNTANLTLDSEGRLNTIQDISRNSIPTFTTISATGLTNGQVVMVSAGKLITSAINLLPQHGNLVGLENDDHVQYLLKEPLSSDRNVISGSDVVLLTIRKGSSSSQDLFQVQESNASKILFIDSGGTFITSGSMIVEDALNVSGSVNIVGMSGIVSGANGRLVPVSIIPISVGGTNNNTYSGGNFVWYNGSQLVSSPLSSGSFLVSANGTINYHAKFISSNQIGNSIVSDNGSDVTIAGGLLVTGLAGTGERYVTVASDGTLRTVSASIGSVSGSGSGTIDRLTKFITSATVGDSIVQEIGSLIRVNGDLEAYQTIANEPTLFARTSDDPVSKNQTGGILDLTLGSRHSQIKVIALTDISAAGVSGTELWTTNPKTGLSFHAQTPGTGIIEVARMTYDKKFILGKILDNGRSLQVVGDGDFSSGLYVSGSEYVHGNLTTNTLNVSGVSRLVGNVTVGNGSSAPQIIIDGGVNQYRGLEYRTSGTIRWYAFVSTQAETSGTDQGAPWRLAAYSDTGAFIDEPISIVRAANGFMTLARPTNFSNNVFVVGGLNVSGATYLSQISPNRIVLTDTTGRLTSQSELFWNYSTPGMTLNGTMNVSGATTISNVLSVVGSNPRVGIGTTNPSRALEITKPSGDVHLRINSPSTSYSVLEFVENSDTGTGKYWQLYRNPSGGSFELWNGSTRFLMTSAGNAVFTGQLNVSGVSTFEGIIQTSVGSFARNYLSKSGTRMIFGDSDGWTHTEFNINSGNFVFEHNNVSAFAIGSSNVYVVPSTTFYNNLVVNSLSGTNTRFLGINSSGQLIVVGNVSADASGSSGRISKFITPISLGNSLLFESGNFILLGSANVTPDRELHIYRSTSGEVGLTIQSVSSDSTGVIEFRDSVGSGAISYIHGSDTFIFKVAGNNRVSISNSGLSASNNMFIGNSLNVSGNAYIDGERIYVGGNSNNAIFNSRFSMYFNIDSDNNHSGGESFGWGHNGESTGSTRLMTLWDSGALVLNGSLNVSGAVSFGTTSSNRVLTTNSSGQIATQQELFWNSTTPGIVLNGTLNVSGAVTASGRIAADNILLASYVTSNLSYTSAFYNVEASSTPYFISRDGTSLKHVFRSQYFQSFTNVFFDSALNVSGSSIFKGSLTLNNNLYVDDGFGLYSTVSTDRRLISRNGSQILIGDSGYWTSVYSELLSGSYKYLIGGSSKLTIQTSGSTFDDVLNVRNSLIVSQIDDGINGTGVKASGELIFGMFGKGALTSPNVLAGVGYGAYINPTIPSTFTQGAAMAVGVRTSGTSQHAYGLIIQAPTRHTGTTIDNIYGLFVNTQTGALSANYAIYTNNGLLRFGDRATFNSTLNVSGTSYFASRIFSLNGLNVSGNSYLTNLNVSGSSQLNGLTVYTLNVSGSSYFDGLVTINNSKLQFSKNNFSIAADTTDGADNKRMILAGGGDIGDDRGACIYVNGNEYSSEGGAIFIVAGKKTTGDIVLSTGAVTSTPRMTITSAGNFGFPHDGALDVYGGGVGVFSFRNCTTAPTTSSAIEGFIMYSEGGAAKVMGGSGTITTFGPAHPHCPNCGMDFMTEHENKKYGYLAVCLNCLSNELGDKPWILRKKLKNGS